MSWHPLPTETVAEAQKRLAALQRKRAVAVEQGDAMVAERSEIAFAAHAGERAAQRRLAEIHNERATHESELAALDAAITEARRRIGVSEAAEQREADRERALAARQRLADMRTAANDAAAALGVFIAKVQQFRGEAAELSRLAIGGPRQELVEALLRRAVRTELHKAGLADVLPPAERRSLATLGSAWAGAVEARIEQLLADPAEAA